MRKRLLKMKKGKADLDSAPNSAPVVSPAPATRTGGLTRTGSLTLRLLGKNKKKKEKQHKKEAVPVK